MRKALKSVLASVLAVIILSSTPLSAMAYEADTAANSETDSSKTRTDEDDISFIDNNGYTDLENQLREFSNGLKTQNKNVKDDRDISDITVFFADNTDNGEIQTDSNGWEYFIDADNNVCITGYNKSDAIRAAVPVQIDGMTVTSISENAFVKNKKLKSIFIPFYVCKIADNAIPETVTVSARHGSAALRYASAKGIPFENLSDAEFSPGVHDLTEILDKDYQYISETRVELSEIVADMIDVEEVF